MIKFMEMMDTIISKVDLEEISYMGEMVTTLYSGGLIPIS